MLQVNFITAPNYKFLCLELEFEPALLCLEPEPTQLPPKKVAAPKHCEEE